MESVDTPDLKSVDRQGRASSSLATRIPFFFLMDCPRCGNVSNLKGSYGMRQTVRRFRECPKCNYKFFTYEIPEKDINDSRDYIDKIVGG